jgi:purine-binding chemotaxis protein CheW
MNETTGPGSLEFLIVEVGGHRYGLPAAGVQEVLRAVPAVPLPGAPVVVEGVINVRGNVVPVLDARRRFGLPSRPLEHTDHLVIVRAAGRPAALRVDRALDLVRLAEDDLEDLRGAASGGAGVRRVAKLPGQMVLLHDDLDALLSQVDVAAPDGALPTPAAGGEHG